MGLLHVRVTLVSAQFGGGSSTRGSLWYQDGADFMLSGQLWRVCLLRGVELAGLFWALGAAFRRPERQW